jgi:hypothetical protein
MKVVNVEKHVLSRSIKTCKHLFLNLSFTLDLR